MSHLAEHDAWLTGRSPLSLPAPLAPAEYDVAFVDRDGTLNRHLPGYRTPNDFEILPGALEALARLAATASAIVIVTNQRGIALGSLSWSELASCHEMLHRAAQRAGARIDGFRVCPHGVGQCECRKPLPGMVRQVLVAAPWARADRCVMIGDSDADAACAEASGVPFARVTTGGGLAEWLG